MSLYRHLRLPRHLPQPEVDAGVEDDQGEQGDEAVYYEVHVDEVNLVIVAILTKTSSHDDQILRKDKHECHTEQFGFENLPQMFDSRHKKLWCSLLFLTSPPTC